MKSVFLPLLCLLAILLYTVPTSAQQGQIDDDKTIIIITKTIDENGEEVVKRIEKTSDELNGESFNIDLDESGMHNIDVNIDINDGRKRIEIKGVDENGEEIDVTWEGDGDIPDEIQDRLKSKGMGNTIRSHRGRSMHHGHAKDDKGFLGVVMGKKVEKINGVESNNGESEAGVVIERVVANSAAEQAGLKAGDVIAAIDGKAVQSIREVSEAIGAHEAGESIQVSYVRDGISNTQDITLKSRTDRESHRSFHWIDDEDHSYHFDFDYDYDYDFDLQDIGDFGRHPCKPFIGVYLDQSGDSETGVAVQRIIPNTPAEEAQLQEGDLITAIDNITVSSYNGLVKERNKHEAGDNFTLTFIRNGVSQTVNATFPACDEEVIKSPSKNRVIIIKKKKDEIEDALPENTNVSPQDLDVTEIPEPFLELDNFRAFPNPSQGIVNLRFEAAPSPIVVTVTDITGKEIFRDAINNFSGSYNEQLDLTEATDGTLLLSIRQDGQVFTDKLIMRNGNRP